MVAIPYDRLEADGDPYDAIVIGSGVGGLGVAALLAREGGRRVLVLERHSVAGGMTHVFSRKGWEWDVGVHYIGGVHRPDAPLRRIFDHVTDGHLEWEPMGEPVDTVVVGGRRFPYMVGRRRWREAMLEAFPGRERAIDRYLDAVRETVRATGPFFASTALPRPVQWVAGWRFRGPFLKWSGRTVAEVLDEITSDALLRTVLTAQWGDYGLPPSRASWAVHAMVFHHYLGGGAYPVGGSAAIAEAMIPVIEAAGGTVAVGAEVSRVLVRRGKADGVVMADGRELRAPVVISDTGVATTATRLLPEGIPCRDELLGILGRVGRSGGHVCLYVGLDAPDAELGLGRSNLWVYPHEDVDRALAEYVADPDAPLPLAFISFPSAKDPTFQDRHPGRATIEVVGFAPFAWFERWKETPWRRRGKDYEAFKERLADRYLEVLHEQVPGIRGHVAYHELSTPLSTRWFCNVEEGEIYGLNHTPARFRERRLQPRTSLPGFWLTGADVCTAGVSGALLGGVLCASAILGKNLMGRILRKTH